MSNVSRAKIGDKYLRSGYGKSRPRKACIYLIDGYAYAKDKHTASHQIIPLSGDLEGYVRVNYSNGIFYEVSGYSEIGKHNPYENIKQ